MQLFSPQQAGVDQYVALKGEYTPARGIFAWGTGTGKTPAAIVAMQRVKASTVLIVCPAVVRYHWRNQIERWAPHAAIQLGVIEYGRERQLTAEQTLARTTAYASLIQIVSYDLAKEVEFEPWDMIILDEAHHLGNPLSKQSQAVRTICEANPQAHILALSATLIPTEVKQLWHILHLLHRNRWGRPSRTGDISWEFAQMYCEMKRSAYGTAIEGANQNMLPHLRKRLAPFTHELSRSDIAENLPPLDVRRFDLICGRPLAQVSNWVKDLPPDVKKIVIFTHHVKLAEQIANELWATRDFAGDLRRFHYCDGGVSMARRQQILEAMQEPGTSAILVATSQSLLEGVRLAWADRVLIAEWQQSPGRVLQLLGRFQAIDVHHKPQIDILTTPDLEVQANRLLQRVADINQVLKGGPPTDTLERVFQMESQTEEQITQHLQALLSGFNSDREQWDEEQA